MAEYTLNILKPSVNNLCVRIFMRAAELDFEEKDVWGQTTGEEYMGKYPAHLTPMIEGEGLPRGALGESCAIMAFLSNKHGLEQFYPSDPGRRAMSDNAMFYLIGTVYPLVARATYPVLAFGQYPGEVATSEADEGMKEKARQDAEDALAEPLEVYNRFFLAGQPSSAVTRRRSRTSGWPRRWSSCARSITRSHSGQRTTWAEWRRRSARRIPSLRPTCAATSSR